MAIQDDLKPNEKFAETDKEEQEAEMNEDLSEEEDFDDSDNMYDTIRDDNSEELEQDVKNLINNLSTLPYYKNRNEGLAKDLINSVLRYLKLKIGNIDNITPTFQSIDLIKIEEKNE